MRSPYEPLYLCSCENYTTDVEADSTENVNTDYLRKTTIYVCLHVHYKTAVDDLVNRHDHIQLNVLQRDSSALSDAHRVVLITTHEDRSVLVPMQNAAVQSSFNSRFHDGFRDVEHVPSSSRR